MSTAILPNLGGPDLIIILVIIAVLSAPGVIAIEIVLLMIFSNLGGHKTRLISESRNFFARQRFG